MPHYWPQKLKFAKNVKETPGNFILLHTWTINQDHMHHWYEVWFLRHEVQQTEFCHLGPFFALYPSNSLKNENIENEKKFLEISSFYTKNHDHPLYRWGDVPETDVTVIFILGYTFPFYHPDSPNNENFKAMKKKA